MTSLCVCVCVCVGVCVCVCVWLSHLSPPISVFLGICVIMCYIDVLKTLAQNKTYTPIHESCQANEEEARQQCFVLPSVGVLFWSCRYMSSFISFRPSVRLSIRSSFHLLFGRGNVPTYNAVRDITLIICLYHSTDIHCLSHATTRHCNGTIFISSETIHVQRGIGPKESIIRPLSVGRCFDGARCLL